MGESLRIEIPDDDQCPVSNFIVRTKKIGEVFEYSKKLSELNVDPRYQDRIQLKNDANGRAVVIWNVSKEDENPRYYEYCGLPTILKTFKITRSTESSITTAAPEPSTTTPGGSTETSTITAAPQPSSTKPGLSVEHLAWLVPVCLGVVAVVVVVVAVVWVRNRKSKKLNEEPPSAELQVLNQNASMDKAKQQNDENDVFVTEAG
ncbi:uncharacterized protein LOC123489647 [Coregonus clupeaformis]|uniref:uncharacterized protein LOC123489647 n=1 Tax=Coregonus clupeaformis TaxID=59861 RepID=UPI001E1C76CF|nr:uncharacterized protein LOC123489647 [Coregonus clupeaformis]